MISKYVVGNIVHVLVGFLMEKNSGPFAEYLTDRLKPSTFQRIAYSDDRRDDALLLRHVRFGGPTEVRYGD